MYGERLFRHPKKNCSSKTFRFFLNKLLLDLGISSCFLYNLFYHSRDRWRGANYSISANNDFSALKRYFSDVVICLFKKKMKNCLIFECDLTLFLGNRSCALGIIMPETRLITKSELKLPERSRAYISSLWNAPL